MMSSIVIDYLLSEGQSNDIGVGYLYFSFQQAQEHGLEALFSSLLQELLHGLHTVPAEIKLLYEKHAQ